MRPILAPTDERVRETDNTRGGEECVRSGRLFCNRMYTPKTVSIYYNITRKALLVRDFSYVFSMIHIIFIIIINSVPRTVEQYDIYYIILAYDRLISKTRSTLFVCRRREINIIILPTDCTCRPIYAHTPRDKEKKTML